MSKLKYFGVNETPQNAGVVILKQLQLTAAQRTTRYRVRYLCCNAEADMAHKSIVARMTRANKGCRLCTIYVAIEASSKKRKPSKKVVKARSSKDLTKDFDVIQAPWKPASWMIGPDAPFIY